MYPLHIQFLGPRVPNFHPLHSTISSIQDIAYLTIFPLPHMLKLPQICYTWLIANRSDSLYSTVIAIFHKVWLKSDQNYRSSSVMKFPSSHGPVNKNVKCLKRFLADGQKSNSLPMLNIFIIRFG